MNPDTPPNRCRIVLIAPPALKADRLAQALQGGDVASLILPQGDMDEAAFQAMAAASPAASTPTASISKARGLTLPTRSNACRTR